LWEFSSEAIFELLGTFWVFEVSSKADVLEFGRPWVKRQVLRRGLGVQISIHIFVLVFIYLNVSVHMVYVKVCQETQLHTKHNFTPSLFI
jgi:hypothetical protein